MDKHSFYSPEFAEHPSLARKLGRAGRLTHRYYHESARAQGAVGDALRGQGRVLALLASTSEISQRELSYLLDMRQQSLSELLVKLEDKGYITRERSVEDGRVLVVRLTDEGLRAAPDLTASPEIDDPLDCLDEDEQKQLEALLDKITASIEGRLEDMGINPHARPPRPHGHHPHGHHPHGCHPHGRHPQERHHDHHAHGWRDQGRNS
ncbi:MAG: MarR family transcriptional regulator [Atopobiaceae bacterium]|nr:MarR family transcriptional regulator [Atopobiaceae bacterium]